MANIEKYSKETIKKAAEIIKAGGLVAFPTETVYGIGASAFNPNAVARIFEVKRRPKFDPLIVHIAKIADIKELCKQDDERVEILIKKFWPGPLTIVLKKSEKVPDIVTAGLDTVAIRMPSSNIALEFIKASNVPIAAPSANIFGRLSPTTAEHVSEQIGEKVDLIIDGGRTLIGVESTVLDLTDEPAILRPGGIPLEDIENAIGRVRMLTHATKPKSPGQLKKHYAPKIPLKIIKNSFHIPDGVRAGLLAFKKPEKSLPFKVVEVLSPNGDLREAAFNFFAALHRLENSDIDIIYAETLPEKGLGLAIMDRLVKAQGATDE